MSISFEVKKSMQVLLFVLHSLGGSAQPYMVFLLFYFADLKFLSTRGRLGFGNFYLAMKYGPAPFNILWLLMELNNKEEGSLSSKIRRYIQLNEKGEIKSNMRYEADYLSSEEVECMFAVIQKYKHVDFETLKTMATGIAWQSADSNGVISLIKMAEECDAGDDILAMLLMSSQQMTQPAQLVNKHGFD